MADLFDPEFEGAQPMFALVETPDEFLSRMRSRLIVPEREPEDWPLPIDKSDLRRLIRLASVHGGV